MIIVALILSALVILTFMDSAVDRHHE